MKKLHLLDDYQIPLVVYASPLAIDEAEAAVAEADEADAEMEAIAEQRRAFDDDISQKRAAAEAAERRAVASNAPEDIEALNRAARELRFALFRKPQLLDPQVMAPRHRAHARKDRARARTREAATRLIAEVVENHRGPAFDVVFDTPVVSVPRQTPTFGGPPPEPQSDLQIRARDDGRRLRIGNVPQISFRELLARVQPLQSPAEKAVGE